MLLDYRPAIEDALSPTLTAPAFVAGGTLAQAATVSSISASTPAATAVGHFLMAFVTINDVPANTVSAPAGWTLLRIDADRSGGTINTSYVFTQFATAGGAASVAFTVGTATNMGAVIFAFSSVDSSVAVNASAANGNDGAIVNLATPSIDAPSANALFVAVRLIATANHQRTNTFSADLAQNYSSGLTTAGTFGAYVGTKTLTTAGIPAPSTSFPTDNSAASLSAGGVLLTFALRAVGTTGSSVFVSKQLVAATDDGEAEGAATMTTTYAGFYPFDVGVATNLNVARFALPAPIPAGATIEKAKLNFATRLAITVSGTMTSVIQAERAIAPATLSTYANYNARAWTTASTSWAIVGTYAVDDPVSTPDVTSIVQAVATEFSGSPLSALSIRFATQASGSVQGFAMWSYDGKVTKAVTLEVTYNTSAGGGAITVTGAGIASAEAFGAGSVTIGAVSVTGAGIATGEAFGVGSVTLAALSVTGTGIATGEAFGTGIVSNGATIVGGTGITSAEAFGAGSITLGVVNVTGTGISSGEAFGIGTITSAGQIAGTGIASGETFGAGSITAGAITVTGTGVASGEAFGTGNIAFNTITVTGTGISSAEAFGAGSITAGASSVTGTGIASLEAFGAGSVTRGAVSVTGSSIASLEAFGVAAITVSAFTVTGTGIPSAEAFGAGSVTGGVASVTVTVRRAEKPAVIVTMRTAAGVSIKQAARAAIRTVLDTNGGSTDG